MRYSVTHIFTNDVNSFNPVLIVRAKPKINSNPEAVAELFLYKKCVYKNRFNKYIFLFIIVFNLRALALWVFCSRQIWESRHIIKNKILSFVHSVVEFYILQLPHTQLPSYSRLEYSFLCPLGTLTFLYVFWCLESIFRGYQAEKKTNILCDKKMLKPT